jgi:hypothetical protein
MQPYFNQTRRNTADNINVFESASGRLSIFGKHGGLGGYTLTAKNQTSKGCCVVSCFFDRLALNSAPDFNHF